MNNENFSWKMYRATSFLTFFKRNRPFSLKRLISLYYYFQVHDPKRNITYTAKINLFNIETPEGNSFVGLNNHTLAFFKNKKLELEHGFPAVFWNSSTANITRFASKHFEKLNFLCKKLWKIRLSLTTLR